MRRYGIHPSTTRLAAVTTAATRCHAVGQEQIGRERGPGEARADGGDGADGAGEDLPVAAPRLGAGDRAAARARVKSLIALSATARR